jgi:adenylosuccinate synthase
MTKLDVLSGLNPVKVATKYKKDGKITELPPPMSEDLESVEPVYEEFAGFELSLKEERYEELHENARKYIEFIESQLGLDINYISVGPEREKLIRKTY